MLKKIVLDLETQKTFDEVGGRGKNHLLKISVCGVYFYESDRYVCYEERELAQLAPLLQAADQIIGFNIRDFDFQVLQPYVNFELTQVPYLDLLVEIERALGHRIKLEAVAQGTLGSGKSGTGLDAITYFRSGRMDQLKKYCLDDVRVTRQVYDYAMKNSKVLYKDFFATREIPLKLSEAVPRSGVVSQGALF